MISNKDKYFAWMQTGDDSSILYVLNLEKTTYFEPIV